METFRAIYIALLIEGLVACTFFASAAFIIARQS
jgi:hypothetical protein